MTPWMTGFKDLSQDAESWSHRGHLLTQFTFNGLVFVVISNHEDTWAFHLTEELSDEEAENAIDVIIDGVESDSEEGDEQLTQKME